MTVAAPTQWFVSGDDRGNDNDITIPNVSSPASGTFALVVLVHQHQGNDTVTGITWGATGATFAEVGTAQGPNGRRNSIWRSLNAPANTTADVTVTMSGNNRPKGADCGFFTSDTGLISLVFKNSFAASNTAITGTVNPIGAGHQLIACCTYGSGGGSVAPTGSVVELWDLDASGPGADSDYWSARLATTGTGAHTIAGTISGTTGWAMIIAEVTDDAPTPKFTTVANGHRAYRNGAVTDAVVIAGGSSGTPASILEGGTFQIRVGVQNNSGGAANFNPQLQYNHNGGGWVNCNAASTVARVVASENVLEGTATTQRSTTGTFTAGSFEDTDGLIAPYSVPNGNFTEVVYTVYVDPAQVAASDTLEFRVDDQASAPPSGTLHLYCSIVAATFPGVVAHDQSVVSVENAVSRWMWRDTNGNLYLITEGGWNQNYDPGKPPAVIRKSADGGLTWRVVDYKDFLATGNGDLEGVHVVNLGSGEWMIVHIETGDDVYGDIFRTSDHATTPDNWVTPLSTIIQDGADSLSALMTHVTAAARQNGQVLAVYSNEIPSAGPDRLFWNLRDTVPAWDASPGTLLEDTGGNNYTGPVMSPGLASRSLLVYLDTTANTLYFRWASSADPPVWSSRVQVNTGGTTVANALNGPVMAFVRYDDTNDYHAVVWLDNSDNLRLNTIKWNGSGYDVGTAPVQVNTVAVESNWPGLTETENLDNQGANGTGVADPSTGTVHMLYADATNRDLYYQTWTEAGGPGTEALEYDAPAGQGVMFVEAVISGTTLVYVWENGVGTATPPGRGMFADQIDLATGQTKALVGSANVVTDGDALLAATRNLAATGNVVTDGDGQLDRRRALAAASNVVTDGDGTILVTRGVTGGADVAVDADAVLTRLRRLAGDADVAADSDAAVSVLRALAATGNVAAAGDATLGVLRALAGVSNVAVDATAVAAVLRALTATSGVAVDADGTIRFTRSLAGTGNVVTDGSGILRRLRKLVGSGEAATDGDALLSALRALTGSGDVAAASDATLPVTRGLAATSDVAVDAETAISVLRALAGTSDVATDADATLDRRRLLAGTSNVAATADAALSILRALTAAADVAVAADATLDRRRSLAGTSNVAVDAAAIVSVLRALGGTADVAVDADGTLTVVGQVALAGTGNVATDATALLAATRALTATGNVAADATAILPVLRALAGSGNVVTDGTATLDRRRLLAATADVAAASDAALSILRALTGSSDVATDATGTLDRRRLLAGTADVATNGTGTLAVLRALAATGNVAVDGTAILSVVGQASLSGSADIAVTADALLAAMRALTGDADTAVDADALLAALRALAGTGDVAASADATLERRRSLAATSNVITDAAAELDRRRGLTATGNVAVDTVGILTVVGGAVNLTGAAATVTDGTGTLARRRLLVADADVVTAGDALLAALRALAGSADVAVAGTGILGGQFVDLGPGLVTVTVIPVGDITVAVVVPTSIAVAVVPA